jgi:hypothetical protein
MWPCRYVDGRLLREFTSAEGPVPTEAQRVAISMWSKTGHSGWGDDWGGKFDPSHPEPFVSWVSNVRRVVCDLLAPQSMDKGVAQVVPTAEASFWRAPPDVAGTPLDARVATRSPPLLGQRLASTPPWKGPAAAPPLLASPSPRPLPGAGPAHRPPLPGGASQQPAQQPSQRPSQQPSSPSPAPAKESAHVETPARSVSDNSNYWQQLQGTPVLIVTPSRKAGAPQNGAASWEASSLLTGCLVAVLLVVLL